VASNTEVVNEAYAAFGRGDIGALLETLSDDVEWVGTEALPQGGSFRGRDGVGEFFAGVAQNWPELEIEIDDLIADGDHVVSVGHGEGKLTGGEAADYGFTHVFTVGDGKIVRFREYAAPGPALLQAN
jgi:ketosteroid isomerase-like protein